ncbi:phage tail tape measure protein [Paracoccus sp. KR1-242]|uniref:phage tail tape measure protein n=1 Tax=Paracoccus sp. KR1-242 TaxID=3410028 RepID=UPI003C11AC5E
MARTHTSTLAVELLDRVTGPAKKVASSLARLGSDLGDVTSVRTRLDAAIARNDAALARARGGVIDAAAGAWALAKAFQGTTGAAMSLEDKMADIGKVSDMNADQLKAFEGSLRKLARSEIPMAVEELAELAAAASASGINDNDLEAFTRQVAKSAVAWGVSGDYAGEALAKIKSALGMTIDETARYADAINYLSDTSASEAPDLIEFARRVAADGAVAGFTNEQVLSLGSAMIAMGAQSDVAATSLRNAQKALTRGASATNRQTGAFKKLGLNAEDVAKRMPTDAMGQFLMVLEKIRDLDQHEQIATMSDLFGDEARALMPLLGQLDQVRKTTAAVSDETNYLGSVQKEFAVRSQTGRYALQRFNNQLRDVGISIGQSLLPAMKQLLETISPVLLAVADWAQQNPKLVASVAAVTAGLVALRVAIAGLRFVGLLGKGGALYLIAGWMSTVGRLSGRLFGAARASIALQQALARLGGGAGLTAIQKIAVGIRAMVQAVPGMGALSRSVGRVTTAVSALAARIGLIGPAMSRAATATEAATARMAKSIARVKFGGLMFGAGVLGMAMGAPDDAKDLGEYRRKNDEAMDKTLRSTPGVKQMMGAYEGAYRWWHGEEPPSGARKKGGPISRGDTYQVGEAGPEVITARRSGYVHPSGSGGGGAPISVNAPITIHQQPGENMEALAQRLKRLMEEQLGLALRSALSDLQLE